MSARFKISFFLLLISAAIFAQIQKPVVWKITLEKSGTITFMAFSKYGWHIYDMNMPSDRPFRTSFVFEKVYGAELVGQITTKTEISTHYNKRFGMNISWYKENPVFIQQLKITDYKHFAVKGYIDYISCNNESCLFLKEEFSLPENVFFSEPNGVHVVRPDTNNNMLSDFWQPVIEQMNVFGAGRTSTSQSKLAVFLLCFIGGLLALLTPCVWPIIPMTVSFFLKRSKFNHRKVIFDAIIYSLSIIVIYLTFGLLITILFGAGALNDLSTNAVFNLLLFVLLVVFAVSFFGVFELTLPASLINKIDSQTSLAIGLLSIFFMAFTLVFTSFSCTGPIIGGLLVQIATMGSIVAPTVGMFGFGLALAIPFFFFAMFPSLLHNLPKSGGWLNSVKIVLGFLELALALKFLSTVDLIYRWHILDREIFLVLWIVIFILLGFYLLGKIRFLHDSAVQHISIIRFFLSIVSFSFSIYMIPGLWGAPLKAISAFLPPLHTQDFNLYNREVYPKFCDYDEGMAYARRNGKPVLLDFTGYGCVNCREMEATVLSDSRVKNIIDNNYVLISLYVDDKNKLPETIEKEECGKIVKLRTIGDKWSYLQQHKFGVNAQPYYVLLDTDGYPLAPWCAYNPNVDEYIRFLQVGLKIYGESHL